MRVIFTCGGTGGHINPAISIADTLKKHIPKAEILFVGARGKMEEVLVPKRGYKIITLSLGGGLDRKFSFQSIGNNINNIKSALAATRQARRILTEFAPDVVIGTGGYASFPTVRAAQKMGIKTIVHESNAISGMTTKILGKKADAMLVNFPETLREYEGHKNAKVVGNPIRQDMLFIDKTVARESLGFDERPLIVSFWGSLGANEMNRRSAKVISILAKENKYNILHASGQVNGQTFHTYLKELGVDLSEFPNIKVVDYIYNMEEVLAAADVVLCRAGASTMSEICAMGKAAIIVPSPNVAENHQEKNALATISGGGGIMLSEKDATVERLIWEIEGLASNPERLAEISKILKNKAILNSAELIYEEMLEVTNL